MPVHVHVPIKIVVDTATVASGQAQLEDALRRASGRALANAYETAVTPRGGYVDLLVSPPTFRWTGEAVDLVDDDRRAALEGLLRAVIDRSIQMSPMADHEQIGADAPTPIPDDPSEPLDPTRFHRAYGLYEIPGYEDGDAVVIPVDTDESTEGESTPVREAIIGIWDWLPISYDEIRKDGVLTDFGRFLYEQAIEDFGEPASEWRGLIFRDEQNMILDFNNPATGGYTFLTIPLREFLTYIFMGRDANPPFVREVQLPYPAATTLKKHGPYSGAQRADVVRQFMEAAIRTRIEQAYPNPNPRVISQEEHNNTITRMVEAEINRRVNDYPDAEFVLYELKIGEYTHLIKDSSTAFDLPETVHLVPITYIKEIKLGGGEGEEGESGAGGGAGGGAEGKRGRGGYGGGAGAGAGQGEQAQLAGFVFTGEGEGGKAMFPIVGGSALELELGAFEHEPKLEDLGADGEVIRTEMRKVAFLLQAPESEYAATFALNALAILGARAAAVGIYAGREQGFTEAPRAQDETGNLGYLNFRPEISPAIQFLRHLASTVPDLHYYTEVVRRIYYKPEHASKFGGRFTNNVVSWMVRFGIALADPVDEGVSAIFVRTCQVLLLQLLRSSHQAIMGRLTNFTEYARVFEQVLLPELRNVQDLIDLREDLQDYQRAVSLSEKLGSVVSVPATPVSDWATASRLLIDSFVATNTAESRESGERGEIVVDNGVVKIFDGQGRLWSLQGLEQAIQYKRGFVEAGDPLVKQLADLEESLDRFSGNSGQIQLQLLLLLLEMKRNNEEQQEETVSDAMHAFEMGQISEDAAKATIPGTTVPLQGIHLMAHETVGEFFRSDDWYGRGVDHIFSVVLGMRGLRTFFEVTIVLGLSVVCPPLGAAVGGGLALYQYAEALEKKQLYESLIDPELVITRAQVEAELFAAQLGVALSFIPEAGGIVARGLGVGVRAGTRAGARVAGELAEEAVEQTATRGIGRAIVGRLSREAAESLKHGVLVAFAREIVTDQVMDALVGKLMIEPIIQEIYREYMTVGPGLHGRGLTTPEAQPSGDRPATDADGNPITYGADGSITVTFRRGAGVDIDVAPPEGGE